MEWVSRKVTFYHEYPLVSQFLVRSYVVSRGEIRQKLDEIYTEDYARKQQAFIRGVDTRLLRKEIDMEKAFEVFFAVVEQMEQSLIDRYWQQDRRFPPKKLLSEMEPYLDILKYGLYTRNPT